MQPASIPFHYTQSSRTSNSIVIHTNIDDMSSKSSSRHSPTRRPKLMRASATAPSLATSNASRKDLADLQNSRAATLLTRVASYSAHHAQMQGYEHGSRSIGSVCSSPGTSPSSSHSGHGGRKEPFEVAISQCGNYFSFPSFEDFEEYHEHEGRES